MEDQPPPILDYGKAPRPRKLPLLVVAGAVAVVTGAGIYWVQRPAPAPRLMGAVMGPSSPPSTTSSSTP